MGFRLPGSGVFGLVVGGGHESPGLFGPLILIALALLLRSILVRGLAHWSNLAYPIWIAIFAALGWAPFPAGFDFSLKAAVAILCFPLLVITEIKAHEDE